MTLSISLMVLTMMFPGTSAETVLEFDIIQKQEVIGHLTAKRSIEGRQVHYHQKSKSVVHMLVEMDVEQEEDVIYQNGYLQRSESRTRVNGKLRDHSIIEWKGDHYEVTIDGGTPQRVKDRASFSIIRLLFEEPAGRSAVFSEKDGRFHSLEKVSGERYEKVNPKGRVNCYDYQNGRLTRADVDGGVIEFAIVRK